MLHYRFLYDIFLVPFLKRASRETGLSPIQFRLHLYRPSARLLTLDS